MAGLIPQPFIDELIHCSDIVEFVDGYVPLKKQGRAYVACCPFHHEKTPSFNVIPNKQFYHCFGCGASGNVVGFVMAYLNLGFVEAIEILAARAGMDIPQSEEKKTQKRNTISLYQCLEEVCQFYRQQLKQDPAAIEYLKARNVNGDIAKQYELGFAPEGWHTLEKAFPSLKKSLIETGMLIQNEHGRIYDRYRQRIMFPIRDRNGRIIGFGGRTLIDEQKPKYLNSPETSIFQKNRELYGLHQSLKQSKELTTIIVVEGYMDVIALAQNGISNAVAALGTATSSFHIQLLSRHCKRIIFCFDGDAAGRQAAWRALENSLPHMDEGIDARFAFLPEGEDPDSYVRSRGSNAFLQFLTQSNPIEQIFFQHLEEGINLSTVAGKSQLINAAQPYFAKLKQSAFKELLTEELARRTHIERHRIEMLSSEKTPTAVPTHKEQKMIQRTPLRLAIALLIQHPNLAKEVIAPVNPAFFDTEEYALVGHILSYILNNSACTTATILEQWRDDPRSASLHRLAAWDHLVPEETIPRELRDILEFLQKKIIEQRIAVLLSQSRQNGLNREEQTELQLLLKNKAGRKKSETTQSF